MKFVFVGPSLPDAADYVGPDICLRPPAMQGDIMKAVEGGASVLGLIDGQFEFVAPVWHKEILFALSKGVAVLGAASMGALRAAECAEFGMQGIGEIYQDYASGRRYDDADVALLYGPAELNYPPISVPLVNVDAMLARAVELGLLSSAQKETISQAARGLFFKDRTWKQIARITGLEQAFLRNIVKNAYLDQKREDALALLEALQCDGEFSASDRSWTFNATPIWRAMYS